MEKSPSYARSEGDSRSFGAKTACRKGFEGSGISDVLGTPTPYIVANLKMSLQIPLQMCLSYKNI